MNINFTNNSIASNIPVSTEGKLRPEEAKGKLVSNPLISVKGARYNAKAVIDGYRGKANDHQLGKINSVGMKIGGLALAGYLMTQKTTPKTKLMELVGLGTFFGAMAIWPKLAISLPAKAVHGFDPNQQYEDSFGRRKPYFQDAQYTPTDLYKPEQLDKIADKMNIPQDTTDRHEAAQSKMKKIATKSNTIWMLTAGLASATLSALACNKAEKVITPAQEKIRNQKADEMLNNFDASVKKQENKKIQEDLSKIFETNKNKTVTTKMVSDISTALSQGLDPITQEGVKEDLTRILINGKTKADENVAEKILKVSKKALSEKLGEEKVNKFLPTQEDLTKHLKTSNMFNKELNDDEAIEVRGSIASFITNKAKESGLTKDELKTVKKGVSIISDKALKSNTTSKLDKNAINKVNNIAKVMTEFNAQSKVLDEYAQIKVADKPETVIANFWNNASESLIKTLKIDFKELEKVRNNRELVQGMLREKIETVTSNDEEYKRVIGEVAKNVSELDQKIKPEDTQKYIKKVGTVYDKASEKLANEGMTSTADKLTALSVGGKGSVKHVKQAFFEERIAGVKNSFSRLINTFDTYRRISKGNIGTEVKGMSREVKEAMVELAKQTALQGHSSDHSIKFYFNRSQNPNPDTSDIEIKNGKVVNKYFNKDKGVDIPGDYDFYQKTMNFMYNQSMDKLTQEALKANKIESQVKTYNKEVHEKIGGADYFTKPNHKTGADKMASSEYKFLLLGVAPDEMFTKTAQQSYNSQKWGKLFGTTAALLTGATMLSQLFLKGGKVK